MNERGSVNAGGLGLAASGTATAGLAGANWLWLIVAGLTVIAVIAALLRLLPRR